MPSGLLVAASCTGHMTRSSSQETLEMPQQQSHHIEGRGPRSWSAGADLPRSFLSSHQGSPTYRTTYHESVGVFRSQTALELPWTCPQQAEILSEMPVHWNEINIPTDDSKAMLELFERFKKLQKPKILAECDLAEVRYFLVIKRNTS